MMVHIESAMEQALSLEQTERDKLAYNKTKFEVSKEEGKISWTKSLNHTQASLRTMASALMMAL